MKFVTFVSGNTTRLGVLDGAEVIDLASAMPNMPSDLREALIAGVDLHSAARQALASSAPREPLSALALAPLLPRPGKIICLGLNYYDHAAESGREKPVYPWFFMRASSSLIGHGQPALRPVVSEQFDFEAELALVIGSKVPRHVTHDEALKHVFGYGCFNDISVRDYQRRTGQWTVGKNFDATGAFGPQLVTADELPPGATNLRIQGRLNGEVVQDANTNDMIWGVAETISLLSECMTLDAGDVIVMGTPSGIGAARKPPLWMKHGDRFEVEIEGVGLLSNPILDERR